MKGQTKGPKDQRTTTNGPTKRRTKGDSQNGKKSRNGTNCGVNDSETSLNYKLVEEKSLALLSFGELATKIVIGYYYKGSAQLNAIKHNGHFQQSYFDSASQLTKKGILNKQGSVYSLTDQGRELASNFVNYFREQRVGV